VENLFLKNFVSRRKDILILVFICLLTIIVRIPFFRWPLISDEGGYAYGSYWWFKGIPLYSDQLWFDRPQGIFLAYKLGMLLLGEETWAIRLWGALWAAGTGVFVYLIAKRLFNNQTAFLASIIYAIFSAMPQIEGFTANGEIFALLPATASAYYLLSKKYRLAGVLTSLAFLMKPTGGSVILLGILWLIYEKEGWKKLFYYVCGVVLLFSIALFHGVVTAGFSNYWFALVGYRYNLQPTRSESPMIKFQKTSIVWIPLSIFTILGFKKENNEKIIFILLWLLSSIIGMAIGKNWEYHYFIQIIPVLALGTSVGIFYIWEKKNFLLKLLTTIIFLMPILYFCIFIILPPETGAWMIYHRPGYQKASEITKYIQNHTTPDETIYVAFYEAEYYFLSNRRSAIPYIFQIYITYIPGAYESLISAIDNRDPTYVVVINPPLTMIDPENRFQEILEKNYYLETYIQGTPIYRRKAFYLSE